MVKIRPMYAADAENVSILEKQIFSQPWTKKGFLDSLKLENTVFLLAEEEETLLGYIGMYAALEEGEITNAAVAPDERRRGIGAMLIQRLLEEAAQRGLTRLVLEVRASNENAIRLYERHGFQKCGIRKGFYEFPKEDAYIMVYGKE